MPIHYYHVLNINDKFSKLKVPQPLNKDSISSCTSSNSIDEQNTQYLLCWSCSTKEWKRQRHHEFFAVIIHMA